MNGEPEKRPLQEPGAAGSLSFHGRKLSHDGIALRVKSLRGRDTRIHICSIAPPNTIMSMQPVREPGRHIQDLADVFYSVSQVNRFLRMKGHVARVKPRKVGAERAQVAIVALFAFCGP